MQALRNLYLFPELPGAKSGYQIAVAEDFERLSPTPEDLLVFVSSDAHGVSRSGNTLRIGRNLAALRLSSLCTVGHPSFFSGSLLMRILRREFEDRKFGTVFLGDINFAQLAHRIDAERVRIRLHNLYVRMLRNMLAASLGARYARMYYDAIVGARLERDLFRLAERDPRYEFLFISKEEEAYAEEHHGVERREAWLMRPPTPAPDAAPAVPGWDGRLVWVGGLSSHKLAGMRYFIRRIYHPLRRARREISLLIIGAGGVRFHEPSAGIEARGFVPHLDYGAFAGALFVNPDVVGGGVKLKMREFYSHGVNCLSTVLGTEGFDSLLGWRGLVVRPIEQWLSYLMAAEVLH